MEFETNNNTFATAVMPDGKPAPSILTPDEAVCFLRLDKTETLDYYRRRHLLNATVIGKKLLYSRVELLNFAERMTHKGDKKE